MTAAQGTKRKVFFEMSLVSITFTQPILLQNIPICTKKHKKRAPC